MSSATTAEDDCLFTFIQDLEAELIVIEALRLGKVRRQQHRIDGTIPEHRYLPPVRFPKSLPGSCGFARSSFGRPPPGVGQESLASKAELTHPRPRVLEEFSFQSCCGFSRFVSRVAKRL